MSNRARRREGGQALVFVALSMTVVLAAAAMVIDGGNAMAQQRGTQNATDAAALAGALTLAQNMGGDDKNDGDVRTAMLRAFSNNDSTMGTSYYVDYDYGVVGTVGRGGSIPNDAAGVQVAGSRTFDTFLAGIVGMNTMTSGGSATAMAGALRSICSSDNGCGVAPVTFSIPITSCDGTSRPLRIGVDWPLVSLDVAKADSGGAYMSIVPLCKNGPGGVGWLDMGCGGNLEDEMRKSCNGPFDIPAWFQTAAGNVNSIESAVNETYRGEMMLIPMFDATCRDIPSTGLPADCTDPGNGNNLYYHIPRFAKFLLDEAYIQGDNSSVCNSGPGTPYIGGNGGTSCFKGWFVEYIMQGRVGGWEDCDEATVAECLEPILGVQLTR
ncbi:MAG TPA: pilus assembly protein TadG-related protein [Aeromicrobium sp.]|nr:pilus assembly protein TadG-related protein [Aeromicrobium sp.]